MIFEAGEEQLLSFPTIVKKKRGLLHITNCRLAWTLDNTDEILISLPFSSIKCNIYIYMYSKNSKNNYI